MPDLEFKSPVAHGPISTPDGAVTVEDETVTAKIVVRAAAGTAAAADLAVPYGQSRLRADGTLVCGTRPDEWTLFAAVGRAAEVAASVGTDTDTVVAHLSGALGLEALAPHVRRAAC
ncbi:MAG: hypothetical protein MK189_07865, partial [Acidimicrobiales bacterium]|nr:hypothetical protein [Acidimicrobiales bacterium]